MEFWSGLIGAAVGGGFALAGAWLQGVQSRRQAESLRRDEQRRGWFEDLRRVYEQVGRHYSGIVAAFETFARTGQETVRIPDLGENTHAQMLLHMHGASDDVLAASDQFIETDREMLSRTPGQTTSDDYDRMLTALGNFYVACAGHLDEVWPTGDEETPWWKFWRF